MSAALPPRTTRAITTGSRRRWRRPATRSRRSPARPHPGARRRRARALPSRAEEPPRPDGERPALALESRARRARRPLRRHPRPAALGGAPEADRPRPRRLRLQRRVRHLHAHQVVAARAGRDRCGTGSSAGSSRGSPSDSTRRRRAARHTREVPRRRRPLRCSSATSRRRTSPRRAIAATSSTMTSCSEGACPRPDAAAGRDRPLSPERRRPAGALAGRGADYYGEDDRRLLERRSTRAGVREELRRPPQRPFAEMKGLLGRLRGSDSSSTRATSTTPPRIPIRIFEYMAAGSRSSPATCRRRGPSRTGTGVAVLADAGDTAAFAEALGALLDDPGAAAR